MGGNGLGPPAKMKQSIHGKAPLVLILLVAAAGIFLLPWYFPVTEPAMGQSYTYGFDNSVAILTAGLALAALFFLALRRHGVEGGEFDKVVADTFTLRGDGQGKLGRSCFAAAAIFCGLLTGLYWYVPYDHWGEMGYFISRVELLLLHRRPYYDFPFPYGPGQIYIPLFFYRIAHGLLSIEQAYFSFLLLSWICGLSVLAWCVQRLFPSARVPVAFWAFALLFFNPSLGCNYTPLRFVLPLAAVLLSHYAVVNAEAGRVRGHFLVGLAAFLGPFLNFESSPEMGMAVTLALLVYFTALVRTPRRTLAHGAVFALLGASAAVGPWSTAYLGILTSFGGAMSLPLFPGPGVLLFLAAEFYLLPRLAVSGLLSRDATGPACLALCVLAGNLIMPAMSRCDMGHVFSNGFTAFILCAAILSRMRDARWFKWGLRALLLVFAVVGSWPFLFGYRIHFEIAHTARAWMHAHPVPPTPPAANGFYFSKPYPPVEGLDPLLAYGPMAVPLGCPDDIEHFLMLNGRYLTGYYPGDCPDVRMLKQEVRQEAEVDGFQTILVPKNSFGPALTPESELSGGDYRFLRNTMLFPVRLVQHHPMFLPERVLAAHIWQRFSVAGEFRDCFIMVNRGAADRVTPPPKPR